MMIMPLLVVAIVSVVLIWFLSLKLYKPIGKFFRNWLNITLNDKKGF